MGEGKSRILKEVTIVEDVPVAAITLPEGLNLEQTAQRVDGVSGVCAAQFEKAARRTDYGYRFLKDPAVETTEGFLFPKRYDFLIPSSSFRWTTWASS